MAPPHPVVAARTADPAATRFERGEQSPRHMLTLPLMEVLGRVALAVANRELVVVAAAEREQHQAHEANPALQSDQEADAAGGRR